VARAARNAARRRARVGAPERRQAILTVITLAVMAVFGGRLVYVQAIKGPAIAQVALDDRLTTTTLPADRGEITDANGVALAVSVERYTITADQTLIASWDPTSATTPDQRGPAGAAAALAPLLELDPAELGAKLVGDRRYVILKKDVLPEVRNAVMELAIPGINAERTTERVYPAGAVGGNVIGFVGADGKGQAGIEYSLNSELSGTAGSETYERGMGYVKIPGGYDKTNPAKPGASVQLTILRDLQYKAQTAVDAMVAKTQADGAAAVVYDVTNGDILALVDSGSVNPNDPGATPAALRGSRAVSNAFEPGSTAKVITMSAALEEGIGTPTSQYEIPGQLDLGAAGTIHDAEVHGLERLTMTGILAKSSNIGAVMIGRQLPKQVRYDYLKKFGFGTATGVGLPGESAGILHPADQWDGRTEYNVLFGQGVAVNAVQDTGVFATIGNGGVHVAPHLVKGVTDADGTYHPVVPTETRVVSQKTAHEVLTMLESVVDAGTGTAAQISGYLVAGKTGTSQGADASGGLTNMTASFIGIVPADKPRLAVSVIVFHPRTSEYGGTVAAPVFSEIASYALQELGIAPSGATATPYASEW
jgi:cell division protein FtsI (penicillin-binding protein 3)